MLLVLVAIVISSQADQRAALPWLGVLAVVAASAQWHNRNDIATRVLIAAEAAVAALGSVLAAGPNSPLLAYLPATTLAAGLALGLGGAAVTTGLIGAILLAGRAHFSEPAVLTSYTNAAAQAALLSLVTGLLAGLLRVTLRDGTSAATHRYAEAYRLLDQLRGVTRQLPGSLDPVSAATTLIAECRRIAPVDRAGVFLQTGGSVLVPLALDGVRRVPWRIDLDVPGPVATAWRSRAPVADFRPPDSEGRRRGSHLLVLPIIVDNSTVGIVIVESVGDEELTSHQISDLGRIVAESGLPLETAVLFDELRTSAALEERERLAKDMHDGIAQDLAYVGFEIDLLLGGLRQAGNELSADHAVELRQRITGLITELRLSMSDLRSSTGPTRGLGAALSEYTRSIGTSSSITVHLSLAEGAIRLPAATELELLRIAHEAIAGARRRAGVKNLWVSLTVEPPMATLLVEDDGADADARERGSDVTVMRERAQRVGATLAVSARRPRGSSVRVEMGAGADDKGAVAR